MQETQKQGMIKFLYQVQGLAYTDTISERYKSTFLTGLLEIAGYLQDAAPVPAGIVPFLADLEEIYGEPEAFESDTRVIRQSIQQAMERSIEDTAVWETLKEADENIQALAGHLATARAFLQELLESKNR